MSTPGENGMDSQAVLPWWGGERWFLVTGMLSTAVRRSIVILHQQGAPKQADWGLRCSSFLEEAQKKDDGDCWSCGRPKKLSAADKRPFLPFGSVISSELGPLHPLPVRRSLARRGLFERREVLWPKKKPWPKQTSLYNTYWKKEHVLCVSWVCQSMSEATVCWTNWPC